jgi:hypothetical protein
LALATVAAPSRSAAQDPAGRVEVVLGGSADTTATMREILGELLGRLAVAVAYREASAIDVRDVVTPRAGAQPVTARVWLELGSSERATLYLADDGWERILVRNVSLADGLDEVAREQLGHIVETGVEALLEGGKIGIARADVVEQLGVAVPEPAAPAPPPTPARDPQPPRGPGAWLELGYQAQLWGGPVPGYHGPVLGAGLFARAPRLRPGGLFTAQYIVPSSIEREDLHLALQGVALRVMAALAPSVREGVALHVALGGGVDVVAARPGAARDSMVRPGPGFAAGFPQAHAELGVRVALGRGFELRILGLVGVDLVDGYFFVSGTPRRFFDPWVPRPGLRVSVAWGPPARGGP